MPGKGVPADALRYELKVLGLEETPENMRRIRRAREVKVKELGAVRYNVSSQRDPSRFYEVTYLEDDEAYYCTCPDFGRGNQCKHIFAVMRYSSDDLNTVYRGDEAYVLPPMLRLSA